MEELPLPPRSTLFTVTRHRDAWQFVPGEVPEVRYAMLGVRACELAAIAIQDRVFLGSGHPDRIYDTVRRDLFTIGVNCTVAGGTCFCVSMETGPRCESGYDLVLTEIVDPARHEFVLEAGSVAGEAILEQLPGRPATARTWRTSMSRREDRIRDGEVDGHRGDQVLALRQPGASPLGRGRRSVPRLHQLHTGVPHLLLFHGRRLGDPRRAGGHPHPTLGLVFHLDFSGLHGIPVRQSRTLPLSAVDDTQAGHLVRPVRIVGMCRLRAVHHVVPGGDRHHRGGGCHPRHPGGCDMNLDSLRERSTLLQALTNTEVALFESAASGLRLSAGEVLFEEEGRPMSSTSWSTGGSVSS
jgi:hypothetical protein